MKNVLPIKSIQQSRLTKSAELIAKKAKSDNTFLAYKNRWKNFVLWCNDRAIPSLPATNETVINYLEAMYTGGYKYATVGQALNAIAYYHRQDGYDSPAQNQQVREFLRGLKRVIAEKIRDGEQHHARKQSKPVTLEVLQKMLWVMKPEKVKSVRDKALLLVGFAGGFRVSELLGINIQDVEFREQGAVIRLPATKTTLEETKVVIVATKSGRCPVKALQHWINVAGKETGPIFTQIINKGKGIITDKALNRRSIERIMQSYLKKAKIEDYERYTPHSLRAGLATQAAIQRVPEYLIREQGRWKSNVIYDYIRLENKFQDNASGQLGL